MIVDHDAMLERDEHGNYTHRHPDIPVAETTFVVWRHRDARIEALAHFADENMAAEYARYMNGRDPVGWCEVRRHTG